MIIPTQPGSNAWMLLRHAYSGVDSYGGELVI